MTRIMRWSIVADLSRSSNWILERTWDNGGVAFTGTDQPVHKPPQLHLMLESDTVRYQWGIEKLSVPAMELQVGKRYEARDGSVWMCFNINRSMALHCQADCINTTNERVEHFYLSGAYAEPGRAHQLDLLKELP